MKPKHFFIFFILLFQFALGQDKPIKKDSVKVYQDIENYSKKRKFTKTFHKLIFKPTQQKTRSQRRNPETNLKNRFKDFDCKIIRKIHIETLDPFGYSIHDTLRKPQKWIEKSGNNLHFKTRQLTIRNFLLFKKNDPMDSLLVKESERLIQQQRSIRNVIIKPVAIANSPDSVDISIRVLDSWSLIPSGSVSSSKGNTEITERNFMGLGHEFENNFSQRFADSEHGYGMRYRIPNFKNTFINTTFYFNEDFDRQYNKGIRVERDFFSPFTRLAGGIGLENRFYRDSLSNTNNQNALVEFKTENHDIWVGHSFRIFKGKTELQRISNLVTTLRYSNTKFLKAPNEAFDPSRYYSNTKLYLASIGVASRKFIATRYIFNNGIPEYVQIGKSYSFTTGFDEKNKNKRAYYAGRFGFGGLYEWGYFGINIEVGTFVNQGNSEQSTFKITSLYFTDLLELGRWKLRQFILPELIIGNNRLAVKDDLLTLEGNQNGIPGFSEKLTGTKKMVLTLQTQSYIPGNLYGFRASPFFNASFGLLANDQLSKSRLYSKFGIGVMISNDYLVFNNFQVSLAYYPVIPFTGDNVINTNTLKNNDITLPDFQIAKPYVIPFD